MIDVKATLENVIGNEGGYTATNDPTDRGGASFAGVTWSTYRGAEKSNGWEPMFGPDTDLGRRLAEAKRKRDETQTPQNRDDYDAVYQEAYWRFARDAQADGGHVLRGRVRAIYNDRFIQPFHGIPECFRGPAVDFGVHSGVKRSTKALQAALSVAIDGVLGPKTRYAAEKAARNAMPVMVTMLKLRLDHYAGLYQKVPDQTKYARGWSKRAVDVFYEGVKDA